VVSEALRGVALAALAGAGDRAGAVADAAGRAFVAGGAFYLLRAGYRRRSGIEGLGLGDVKLAAAAGPWLMWPTLPLAVAMAAIAALLTVLVRALVMREPVHGKLELPFGAFLAPAVWLSFLLERVWHWPA
jgi:leader peptidase (prepilin peptidase)/N-methyltransferase